MNDDRLYLIHIAECIQHIDAYTRPGREVFLRGVNTAGSDDMPSWPIKRLAMRRAV